MAHASKASRLMGLLVLLMSIMAFAETAARAEPGAHWLVNGVQVTNALDVQGRASLVSNHGILLTKVGLSKVEILCTSLVFAHALLRELGGGTGKIAVGGCITKLNGTTANACKPKSPGAESGVIITNQGDALIKSHTTGAGTQMDLVELLPTEGTAIVTLELGATCAIGNKIEITGKVFVEDSKNEGLVDQVTHTVEEGPLSQLLFGANPATIDGSANVSLTGPHIGMTAGGHTG